MWVADMDFRPPPAVNAALAGRDRPRRARLLRRRPRLQGGDHRLDGAPPRLGGRPRRRSPPPTASSPASRSACRPSPRPATAVILFTPVYHAFFRVLRANGRAHPRVAARPARRRPLRHGPRGARRGADRARAHDRALLAAQPRRPGLEPRRAAGARRLLPPRTTSCSSPTRSTTTSCSAPTRHVPMPLAAPEIADRLVMLTAATKTFNLAGALTGNVIIPDPAPAQPLRRRPPRRRHRRRTASACSRSPPPTPGGAAWVDALRRYLAGNAALFAEGVAAIPGVRADAARCDLPRLGRLRRHRHGAAPSSPPASSATPASPPSHGAHLRRRRRELPALQHRHPARPRRGGGRAACRPPSPTCSRGRHGSRIVRCRIGI